MIICNWLGWLSVGINSTLLAYFTWGFAAQWLRRYRPVLYAKWHLTVVAAIAGGCSIIVFILTFAVDGGTGVTRSFPVSLADTPATPLAYFSRIIWLYNSLRLTLPLSLGGETTWKEMRIAASTSTRPLRAVALNWCRGNADGRQRLQCPGILRTRRDR